MKNTWKEDWMRACLDWNVSVIKKLLERKDKDVDIHAYDDFVFRCACSANDLEMVKYLLTSEELRGMGHEFSNLHAAHEQGILIACERGYLEIVKYLLTSPELKAEGHKWVKMSTQKDKMFNKAMGHGHLDIVKYLLTDKDLKKKHKYSIKLNNPIIAHSYEPGGMQMACTNGHLNTIQYILTSPEMEGIHEVEKWRGEDKDIVNDLLFEAQRVRNEKLIRWLIFDYQIEDSKKVRSGLEDKFSEMFDVRKEKEMLMKAVQKGSDKNANQKEDKIIKNENSECGEWREMKSHGIKKVHRL